MLFRSTGVRHSIYLFSLSRPSWSLMLHTVSTYPYGSSIGHRELNFSFSFLTHYHHHQVYQCHLCQPLNHILLNIYSVNHVCFVYAHSSLLCIQIISGPDRDNVEYRHISVILAGITGLSGESSPVGKRSGLIVYIHLVIFSMLWPQRGSSIGL